MQILEHIIVFMLDIRLWTGRKKLKAEDLAVGGVDIDKLPPGTLASLGSKRIIGSEALSPFLAIKREAEKVCLGRGVRFLNGFAVPVEAADEVAGALSQLQKHFEQAKTEFLQSYDQAINDWARENPPEWEGIIRAAVDPVSHVGQALQFRIVPVAVSVPEDLECAGLSEPTSGLLGQLCHEVRVAAKAAFVASYAGKRSVTRKALRPIHAIREKLLGLSFLDPLVEEAIAAIDATLALVPAKGPITGVELNMLAGLLGRQLARLGKEEEKELFDVEETTDETTEEDSEETAVASLSLPQMRPPQRVNAPLAWDF